MEHLTTQELVSLRNYITSQVREARKKSNQLLNKDPEIRKLWMDTISFKPGTSDDEKRAALATFLHILRMRTSQASLSSKRGFVTK
jgi:hypothetical protein